MAVAGSATSAFKFWLSNGKLQERAGTYMSDKCYKPAEALALIELGDAVWVMGSDVWEFRKLWAEQSGAQSS